MQPQDQQDKQKPQPKTFAAEPQQTNVNKWADQGQAQAGAMQQVINKQVKQSDGQPAGQKSEAFVQPPASNQPKEAQEDRSKSFGEIQQGGQGIDPKSQQPGETGIIPKENSFPTYKEELPGGDIEQPESFKH